MFELYVSNVYSSSANDNFYRQYLVAYCNFFCRPNSGDCVTISYKSSDDQLAISTSPWYSTRTGSSQQADLDTMSTGVTILDMSSPPDISATPGSPGSPSFQAIDTKVTDISWLPSLSDTDGTSTMYKETAGSTVGGTTKEETSSTGVLGTDSWVQDL